MIADPLAAAASKLTSTNPLPAVAVRPVGRPGSPTATTDSDIPAAPVPARFTARTWNVYSSPGARPAIVIGPAGPDALCPPASGFVVSLAVTV